MNEKIILFQGDSITDCCCSWNSDTNFLGNGYPNMVIAALGTEYPYKYNFHNKGISGNRIVDVYARIKADIINLKPDYMSILIGINDCWQEYTSKNGVDAEKFEMVYGLMIEELQKALPNLKIMILEPFVLPGFSTENTEEYPDRWDFFKNECTKRRWAAKRIADKYGLTFIPLQDIFNKANADAPVKGYWLLDGVHPTPAGHLLITREWLKAFEQIK